MGITIAPRRHSAGVPPVVHEAPGALTKRLAIIGSVLSAIVFVTTMARPNALSEWPPLVQAAGGAAGAFFMVWLLAPLIAYLGYLAMASLRKAFRRFGGPDT